MVKRVRLVDLYTDHKGADGPFISLWKPSLTTVSLRVQELKVYQRIVTRSSTFWRRLRARKRFPVGPLKCKKRGEWKGAEDLRASDMKDFPVWEFVNADEIGETVVRPVRTLPVQNLFGRLVGTPVHLACGRTVFAQLGNVDSNNPEST